MIDVSPTEEEGLCTGVIFTILSLSVLTISLWSLVFAFLFFLDFFFFFFFFGGGDEEDEDDDGDLKRKWIQQCETCY